MRTRVTGRTRWMRLAATLVLGAAAHAGAEPAAVAGKDVRISGRVADATTERAVPGAVVYVRDWRAVCDSEGRFFITVPEGRWTLEAAARDYQPLTTTVVDACADCRPEVEILLVPARLLQEQVTVSASVNGGSDLVATTPVRPAEVLNAAGAFENVFRVLHTLPGVTNTGELSSRMSVRGGGPDQNMTVMDGIEIHNPYRLYGLVSAFNPETVEGFELSTGAFSAQYGDRLSSILTIDNREGKTTTLGTGSLGLSLTDGNAIFEGRLPRKRGSWLVTGRRTWYDLVADQFTDDDLPGFSDLQGKLALDLGGGRRLTLTGLRSRERADMEFSDELEQGVMNTRTKNDLAAASLLLPLGSRVTSRTIAALYDNTDDMDLDGDFRADIRRSNSPYDDVGFGRDQVAGTLARKVRDRSLRQELTLRPFGSHVVGAGFEWHDLETREKLEIDLKNRPTDGLRAMALSYDAKRSYERFGAWLYERFRAGGRLDGEIGLRYDESRLNEKPAFQPRVSLTAHLGAGTRLRGAFGVHTQSPGYEKLFQADYVVDLSGPRPLPLENERARHVIVGLERDLAAGMTARVEGFYKRFSDLLVGRLETPEEVARRLAAYDYPAELASALPRHAMITEKPTNDGSGRAYGFDAFLIRRPTSSATRLSGWLAYTFTSAEREAYGRTYPFEYEQPHALSLVANWRAHQRLELSLTSRVVSGFPRTAPLGLYVTAVRDKQDSDRDGNRREFLPERDLDGRLVYAIDYGGVERLNDARQPLYARFDFRATFIPRWGKGRWRLYLDVINALGTNNGLEHDELEHDPAGDRPRIVTKREDGFPLLPSFGVHVRF